MYLLSTDVAIDELSDESHHHRPSPLRGLGIGLVNFVSTTCKYMHLACLGITRKPSSLNLVNNSTCEYSQYKTVLDSTHSKVTERIIANQWLVAGWGGGNK